MKRGGPWVTIPVPASSPSKKKSAAAIALNASVPMSLFLTSQRTRNSCEPLTYVVVCVIAIRPVGPAVYWATCVRGLAAVPDPVTPPWPVLV